MQESAHFYPRSPCGERRPGSNRPELGERISIHVPLAGNVLGVYPAARISSQFLSTFPLRGTSPRETLIEHLIGISIHVPLAGNVQ